MSDSPVVSCIMPTKNRRKFVSRSIQMWLDAEREYSGIVQLIVLEDGDDNCQDLTVARSLPIMYRRFEGSLGAKLNEGARLARGKYIINWDDDDFQHPSRIANVVKHLELTGAAMVGMSSMPYWREGDKEVWIYNAGDARYCTGSGQAFRRDWALANPHPDISLGEDEYMTRRAAAQNVLSTISGTDWVVACTHGNHCSERRQPQAQADDSDEARLEAIFGRRATNWQQASINDFPWVQQWAFQASA
jgi:glycosyltransferase involved in cell wall biosynthesis